MKDDDADGGGDGDGDPFEAELQGIRRGADP